ncbi:uncharacterized protein isoform X2 [Musca autumnalis]|uniref:uncharacterized protein isoform X2 n=1 Tax=Musca autumnalis TaxID=221902 RepID=UPI003CEAF7BD
MIIYFVIRPKAKTKSTKSSELSIKEVQNSLAAPQRRALYHSSRLNDQVISSNGCQTPPQEAQHISPALIVQRRPPLVRAMSAPVRSIDDNSKGSFLANNKRKSRRRKLNTRAITCDRDSSSSSTTTHLTNVSNLNLDSKSSTANKKILQRSRSVAPDVITLVSLISSEGSDSEKEDYCSSTPSTSDSSSPTRRAPSLRKSGKSVSFQENYPPTFQFASKEYSHMLRRGSIAPLAARIKSNRPPTAPPGSIFHTTNSSSATNKSSTKDMNDETDVIVQIDENKNNANITTSPTTDNLKKSNKDEITYKFPDYVRSIKERECWKLFQKMSAKGVNITYDTILRGMLTPTEFRQLQKQREMEEAKALLRENEERAAAINEEQMKNSRKNSPLERIAENLPKN